MSTSSLPPSPRSLRPPGRDPIRYRNGVSRCRRAGLCDRRFRTHDLAQHEGLARRAWPRRCVARRKPRGAVGHHDLTERPPRLLEAAIAINPQTCELVHTDLPSSGTENTGRGGASYDPTCEAHAPVAKDRPACDRRVANDYLDLGLGWSLATNYP